MTTSCVLFAGLPRDFLGRVISRVKKRFDGLHVIETLALDGPHYTARYANDLYALVGRELRELVGSDRYASWNLSIVMLYVVKPDRSEQYIVDRFDTEVLLAPMSLPAPKQGPKRHRAGATVNNLVQQAARLIRSARRVLSKVGEEVTNRDARTCLLLPPVNYGGQFEKVKQCVQHAVAGLTSVEQFDRELTAVVAALEKDPQGRFRNRRLVFRAPGKAGARHGAPAIWDADGHSAQCVIRGRVRFGASYDPKFHYDCNVGSGQSRQFVNCHGESWHLPRGRGHVNIAPNDHVR